MAPRSGWHSLMKRGTRLAVLCSLRKDRLSLAECRTRALWWKPVHPIYWLPTGYRVAARTILGGLHHEYHLELAAA
jgi:hypothetical protein